MVRFISLDIDGTLVERSFTDRFWYESIPKLYAKEHKISLDEAKRYVSSEYDKVGEHDIRWYLPSFWVEHFGLKCSIDEIMKETGEVKLYPDVQDAFELLGKKYGLIVITSNPSELCRFKLKGLENYFEFVLSSVSDLMLAHKEAEVYREALRRLDIEPQEMAHVGDDEVYDLQLPRSLGIHSFLIDRSGKKMGEHVVKNLLELYERLSKLP